MECVQAAAPATGTSDDSYLPIKSEFDQAGMLLLTK